MKTTLKLLSLSSALLLGLFNNQSQSYENREIDPKSDLLISNSIENKKIKTVTASGYGTSIESAAQNAAKNALTNVVGTFMSAKFMLEKRSNIVDGILSESKIIKKNINNYSKGSINYFEILNTQQNGSLYQVTARVDVKIDDFRAYIKKLALKTKKISTTNLIAEMRTNKNNLDNKFKFFQEIITPIYEGEVIDIEIGELQSLKNLVNDKNCTSYLPARFCKPLLYEIKYMDIENSVFFTFTLKLKKDFYANSINTLENISDSKPSSIPFDNLRYSRDVGLAIRDHRKQTFSKYYLLKDIGPRTVNYPNSTKFNSKYIQNYDTKKLKIDLLDSNKEIVYSFIEECGRNGGKQYYKFNGGLKSYTRIHSGFIENSYGNKQYIGNTNYCPSQLYATSYDYQRDSILFDISSQKSYMFAFEIDDLTKLKEIQAIKIEYMN